jgi:hypothetical protein
VNDYGPLLNPQKEPPSQLMTVIDFCSWVFPALSAVLAIGGGYAALYKADQWAAAISIVGGIIGAFGVLATNWASRVRDNRIEWANSMAALSVDMADSTQRRLPAD